MARKTSKNARQAMKHLERLRQLVAQRPSPFAGMTKDAVIEELRKTRERLWEQKLGIRV